MKKNIFSMVSEIPQYNNELDSIQTMHNNKFKSLCKIAILQYLSCYQDRVYCLGFFSSSSSSFICYIPNYIRVFFLFVSLVPLFSNSCLLMRSFVGLMNLCVQMPNLIFVFKLHSVAMLHFSVYVFIAKNIYCPCCFGRSSKA